MSDDDGLVGFFCGVLLMTLLFGLFLGIVTARVADDARADGYCYALNGTRLNSDSCDVAGRVVEIEYPEESGLES
jgi:hypothetical protein